MKLFLSSYRIPTPEDLSELLKKQLDKTTVALIPNAKDYYTQRPWDVKVGDLVSYFELLGLEVEIVDLRKFNDQDELKSKLRNFDLVWAMGGNTYMLRYEMKRSGFDKIIHGLIEEGCVYGGDSAGALVAGPSIAGVELADDPRFAKEVILEGLGLIDSVILPHTDNPEFNDVMLIFREKHKNKVIIELKDSQAVIFDGNKQKIVES